VPGGLRGPLLVSLALVGCARERVGPLRPVPLSARDLIRRATERAARIEGLYDAGAVVRVRATAKDGAGRARTRSGTVQARIAMGREDGFRLDARHALAGNLATIIFRGGDFFFVDLARSKKAYTGDALALLQGHLAGVNLGREDLSPRQLLVPSLEPRPGERAVLSYLPEGYRLTYIVPGRVRPTRVVDLDWWSHAPSGADVFDESGRVVARAGWSLLRYDPEVDAVVAREVRVCLPGVPAEATFLLSDPQVKALKDEERAFRFAAPAGMPIVKISPGSLPASCEAQAGDGRPPGDTPAVE
jgi:hypothetical protein